MKKSIYGYARVSSAQQNEDRQIIALTEYGVQRRFIYIDCASGKDFDRRSYKRMMKKLKRGDVLVIKSIDRLGRNYEEIIEQWRHITKEIGAELEIIDMPVLNTNQYKDLVGTLISDLVLQILSFVAQNEREAIRQRQAEGIAAARARGIHLGRKREYIPEDYIDVFNNYRCHYISIDEALGIIGCSKCTFYYMMKELRKSGKVY